MTFIDTALLQAWLAARTPAAMHATDTHDHPVYGRAKAYQEIDAYLRREAHAQTHNRGHTLRPDRALTDARVMISTNNLRGWLHRRATAVAATDDDRRTAYLDLALRLDEFTFDPAYREAFPAAGAVPAGKLMAVWHGLADLTWRRWL